MEVLEAILEAVFEFGIIEPICGLLVDWKSGSSRGFDFNELPLSGRNLIKFR